MRQMILLVAVGVGMASPLAAQTAPAVTPVDSTSAMYEGIMAAKRESVAGYFFTGVVTAPVALGSLAALTWGDVGATPVTIGSPLILFVAGAKASRPSRLPPGLRSTLQGRDSAYVRAFTRSYDSTLKSRRQSALGLGSLTGVVASVLFLAMALRNYT